MQVIDSRGEQSRDKNRHDARHPWVRSAEFSDVIENVCHHYIY
jgi:hypothetical protein